jgi:hypothetical protein
VTPQDALPWLDNKQIQAALMRPEGLGIPTLVFGVSARADATDLKSWSDGAIRECAMLTNDFRPNLLEVASSGPLTRTLAGLELPAVSSPTCDMRFAPGLAAQTVLAVRGNDGTKAAVLVHSHTKTSDIFFVPLMKQLDVSWLGNPWDMPKAFSSSAPFILFLSYAAREYAWHLDGHYANLTIDDPWLTQPYGNLDYPSLLVEMEKHNFHTTIAFIPWNFDRSEPDIANLFRAHPERFSVTIHGNDHKHREFGSYDANPLLGQIGDIKQGVARMEQFRLLTGINYDRVMVFPHGVAPEATFAALRNYNFLGTANYSNVPLDAAFPTDPAFLLRPYTVAYANFLSFSRYSASGKVPRLEVAIQSFLGNPLLFSGHENLFHKGIDAFNAFADCVNTVQPDTRWTSLGEIARHSHLLRHRIDGGIDVRMFSNEMDLRNPTAGEVEFHIQREEILSSALIALTIDGAPATFEHSMNLLTLRLVIPPNQVRKIRITYQNDMNTSGADIRKRNLHAYALRMISDFRDLYLSKSSWGHAITQAYYGYGWDSVERYLEGKWWVVLTCIGLVFAAFLYGRLRSRVS